ncbi:hypothetical protein G977_04780 [Escherichia coli UMEA 3585-1]|nr:hypothetical protein G973_04825 [Escherichia coli UMEA 3391-1]EQZ23745.1 hypothetical protein G977_04780 [Escherichia coli UMEA 3585-1]
MKLLEQIFQEVVWNTVYLMVGVFAITLMAHFQVSWIQRDKMYEK